MRSSTLIGRRAVLSAAALAMPAVARAQSDLEAAAANEGVVVFHTSIDLPVAQKMASLFQERHPKLRVQLERSGAERVLQRITQEYASNIYAADVVESSDSSMFVDWKAKGWLANYVAAEVQKFWPKEERDPDGRYAGVRTTLSVIAYNTKQVKPEDAPKGFADLLSPKWRLRMVKAHPGYSGTILTSTFATERALGWGFYEELAQQKVLQVQSASDPPKKVAQGERSIMVDGSEYVVFYLKESGNPIEVVYAAEGSPLVTGHVAVMEKAPHPNAARLFDEFLFSRECQQLMSDAGGTRSFHPDVKLPHGRKPLSEIKALHTDPNDLQKQGEAVKKCYTEIFGV